MAIRLSLSRRRMINEALKLKLDLEAFSANQTEVIKIQFFCATQSSISHSHLFEEIFILFY